MSRKILSIENGQKPPPATHRLLNDENFCREVVRCYPTIEKGLLALQLSFARTIKGAEEAGPTILAISAALEYFQAFKEQGEADIKSSPPPPDASQTNRKARKP